MTVNILSVGEPPLAKVSAVVPALADDTWFYK